jgi:hypothetical protein
MTPCGRCDQPTPDRYRARLRRTTGRGHVLTEPSAFCPDCSVTVAALLAPASLVKEPTPTVEVLP